MYSPLIDILFGDFIISKKIHLWNFYFYRTHVKYQKLASKIDSIGEELKQVNNSIGNVGYSDPFCQDSFLMNLSLGDKHTFLQNIGTDYPLLPLMVMNLGIINVSRTCHEVVPASLIH